jgi:hypothetical protein
VLGGIGRRVSSLFGFGGRSEEIIRYNKIVAGLDGLWVLTDTGLQYWTPSATTLQMVKEITVLNDASLRALGSTRAILHGLIPLRLERYEVSDCESLIGRNGVSHERVYVLARCAGDTSAIFHLGCPILITGFLTFYRLY